MSLITCNLRQETPWNEAHELYLQLVQRTRISRYDMDKCPGAPDARVFFRQNLLFRAVCWGTLSPKFLSM